MLARSTKRSLWQTVLLAFLWALAPDGELGPAVQAVAAPFGTTLRFAVVGDYGYEGDAAASVAQLVRDAQPDLIVTTGDNNYPDGEASTIDRNIGQYYSSFIAPYAGNYGAGAEHNRFFPVLGNHDWHAAGALPYLDYFALPGNERYYDFVAGPVHFFALDSDQREPDGRSAESRQANWLRGKLASSRTPWRIVYMHHPPYSSGDHGNIRAMQWPFEEMGATAVLAGHDHSYERIDAAGFPYFVNGLGGAPTYDFGELVSGSRARYTGDYGAMIVDAGPDLISYRFVSLRNGVVDQFRQCREWDWQPGEKGCIVGAWGGRTR